MRLSQIQNKNLKEAGLSDVLQTILSPKTDRQEKPSEFKSFINKFVERLTTNLNLAIEQGSVDPRKSIKQAHADKLKQTQARQIKSTQNLNAYVKQMSTQFSTTTDNNQKRMIARELLDYMADRKDYPEWQNAVGSAIQVVKRSGMDQEGIKQTIDKLRQGNPSTSISESFEYDDISLVLETIINESQAISVSDYVKNFIIKYYSMVKSPEDKNYINKLVYNIDKEYADSRGMNNENTNKAITLLAKTLYSLSTSASSTKDKSNIKRQSEKTAKKAKVTVKDQGTDQEEYYINKIKLDPNNPNDAATIAAIKNQQAKS